MSTTATKIDVKTVLKESIQNAAELMVKDLKHIPEDKLTVSPMGCARSPLAFIAEVVGFNMMVAGLLSGKEAKMLNEDERTAFENSFTTKEKGSEEIKSSTKMLCDALDNCSEEDLAREVTAPWGMQMKLYKMAQITGSHMMYHDGQLNYIQCLYGDGAFHWMEE